MHSIRSGLLKVTICALLLYFNDSKVASFRVKYVQSFFAVVSFFSDWVTLKVTRITSDIFQMRAQRSGYPERLARIWKVSEVLFKAETEHFLKTFKSVQTRNWQ